MKRLFLAPVLLACACSAASAPSPVTSLLYSWNVSPNGVFVGDHVQLNAQPLDLNGGPVPVAIVYSSSNTSVATIDQYGLITTLAAGTSSIGISAGGQSAHLTLTVDGNVTGSVQVTPANPTTSTGAGEIIQLTAAVLTTLGNPARGKAVTWSTSDATRATVDATGLVHPLAAGVVSICATAIDNTSAHACATVTITVPV